MTLTFTGLQHTGAQTTGLAQTTGAGAHTGAQTTGLAQTTGAGAQTTGLAQTTGAGAQTTGLAQTTGSGAQTTGLAQTTGGLQQGAATTHSALAIPASKKIHNPTTATYFFIDTSSFPRNWI